MQHCVYTIMGRLITCIGGNKMKKLILGTLLLSWLMVVPVPTMAGVDVNVSIGLPLPIAFAEPPELIVLPGTYVYVVPDIEVDLFFYNGWWWRPWQGHWYRSRHDYNSGWEYYQGVPSFYVGIPPDWRDDYRHHRWGGHRWNYQRIHHQEIERNWGSWEKSKHWEKQQTWGVQGFQPRTRSQQKTRKSGQQFRGGQQQNSQQQQGNHEKGKGKQQNPEGQQQHSEQQQGGHEEGRGK